jgi:hypothetical protein
VHTLAGPGAMVWAGGSDAAEEGTWRWITGPEAGQLFYKGNARDPGSACYQFCAWSSGEPNDFANEDVLVMNWANYRWNDHGAQNMHGYFVEYNAVVGQAPEPATWAMMFAGFGMMGASIRRRRTTCPNQAESRHSTEM